MHGNRSESFGKYSQGWGVVGLKKQLPSSSDLGSMCRLILAGHFSRLAYSGTADCV